MVRSGGKCPPSVPVHGEQADGPVNDQEEVVEGLVVTNLAVDEDVERSLGAEEIDVPAFAACIQDEAECEGWGQVPGGMQERDESIGAKNSAGDAQQSAVGFAEQDRA